MCGVCETYGFWCSLSDVLGGDGSRLLVQLVVGECLEAVDLLAELHVLQTVLQGQVPLEEDPTS